ncbi:MAG: sugar phosphate isomerase/epimerase [Lachnospiraceae bacterium]|nr:sugar phosphate isomerase/epimerase [Lachnospiraceae bacterium]
MELCIQTGGLLRHWGEEISCEMIRDAGFKYVDWNFTSAWNKDKVRSGLLERDIFECSQEEIHAHFQKTLDTLRVNGLEPIQAHAPFPPYVPGAPEFVDRAIEIYKNCIRYCDSVGVKYLVIHGISLELTDYTQSPESIHRLNHHLYESLIPVLCETEVIVCLENLFTRQGKQIIEGTCSVADEAIAYIDRFNALAGKECFGLCLDTGHLNLLGKNQAAYIRALGKRIKALHVHDNNGVDDEHRAPYTGTIIWKDVIGALKEVGYEGVFNFETFGQVAPKRGIDLEVVPIWLRTICDIGLVFKKWMEV